MMFVDSHETRSQLPSILSKIGVPTSIVPLEVGDYVVIGRTISVCTESKTADDYIGSISDNQLNNELYQMSCNYTRNILMVYGSIDDALMCRGVSRSSYYEYLAGCVIRESDQGVRGAISVVNFDRVYDAGIFLKTIHNMVIDDHIIRRPEAKKFKITDETRKRWAVQMFHPLIGNLRAKHLLNRFKTIKDIVNAEPEELESVERIGDKISKDLYKFVNEKGEKE